ncbi:MAG TPA: aldehyde dehydrogenase family protein, partial [Paracoccaceae bacterium]|nr:aldehyde dehydrogenase family protein [Paracoccaceae bacterium]
MDAQMLIGANLVTGNETGEEILNPRTGEIITTLPEASLSQVDEAVTAAENAFKSWARTTPAERSRYLLKLAERIEAEAQTLAALEALNCGKPTALALGDELPAIIDCFRFFAGAVRCMTGPLAGEYIEGHTSMIRRDPVGVVASIAPWNYPLMMMAWKIAPAIGAGNTVVFKPSEQTPLTALAMAKIFAEVLPEGVVNIVLGRGETVGSALINHPKVAMISVTGDIATGRKILEAANKTIKRTHLELGGKAPVIVFDDADIPATVEGLRAFGYYNAGQDCTAACRIYAHASVYDNFVADLTNSVSEIAYGLDDDSQNEMGPLI